MYTVYRNDPKFSDRYAWANSADLDQTAFRGAVWSGSTLFAIPSASFWHYSKVEPHSSNFRVITTNFLGVWIFRKFTVMSFTALVRMRKWATTRQNQQNSYAPSEDSDQPGHPPSLIRVFAVRMKEAWVLSYPLSAQRRLWSDWADLSLRWVHILLVLSCRSSNIFLFLLHLWVFRVIMHWWPV